jgi:hypothetical protein
MTSCDTEAHSLTARGARFARRAGALTTLAFCLSAFLGCQGSHSSAPTYEVKGKVLLAGGKPLSSGLVKFVSADGTLPEVSGEIQPDGAFAITTRNPGDGAAAGKYKVRIEPVGRKDPRKLRLNFPAKYVDEDSSGIEVVVRAEANQLDPITLK